MKRVDSYQCTANSMSEALRSADTHRLIRRLAQYELALPVLCFLAGHRPLAFVVSQGLYLAAPLALLLGLQQWSAWAALLGSAQGIHLIEAAVAEELNLPPRVASLSPER